MNSSSGHLLVCGCGHVGYRVADLLLRLGQRVTVVYDQAPADWLAELQGRGATCVQGDARSASVLQAAGVASAQAVLAVTDRDLVNLETAMDARRLNPEAAIVLRLFDTELAPHVEEVLGVRQALSATALAAPVFASAALGQDALGFLNAAGHTFVLAERHAAPPGSGPGIPLFAVGSDELLLPADQVAQPTATLVVEPALVPLTGLAPAQQAPARAGRLQPLLELLVRIPAPIKTVLLAIAGIVLFSVVLFHFALDLPYCTALYFVVTTVTTVGYGDISLLNAPWYLQLYGVFIMLCGATLLATLFGVLTDFLLRTRFRNLLGGQPQPEADHVIVAGLGNLGYRITRNLQQTGTGIVCVGQERDAGFGEALRRLAPVIQEDPRQEQALLAAGIGTARAVIATQDDDIANLGLALAARQLNPKIRTVARVFDAALGAKLQQYLKLDRVLSVSAVAAPVFVGAALCPHVVHAFVWHRRLVIVCLHKAGAPPPAAAPLAGLPQALYRRYTVDAGAGAGAPVLRPCQADEDGTGAAVPVVEFVVLPLADAT